MNSLSPIKNSVQQLVAAKDFVFVVWVNKTQSEYILVKYRMHLHLKTGCIDIRNSFIVFLCIRSHLPSHSFLHWGKLIFHHRYLIIQLVTGKYLIDIANLSWYKKPCTTRPSIFNFCNFLQPCYLFAIAIAIYIKNLPSEKTGEFFD